MASTNVFKWKNKSETIVNWFRLRRINDEFADFTLWCDGRPVRCHKSMLAAVSPYFNGIFAMDSSTKNTYLLNMSFANLMDVLTLIYGGSVIVDNHRLQAFEHAIRVFKINAEHIERGVELLGFDCKNDDVASNNSMCCFLCDQQFLDDFAAQR